MLCIDKWARAQLNKEKLSVYLYRKDSESLGVRPVKSEFFFFFFFFFFVHGDKTAFGQTTKAYQTEHKSHLICFHLLLLRSGTKFQFYLFCQLTIIC